MKNHLFSSIILLMLSAVSFQLGAQDLNQSQGSKTIDDYETRFKNFMLKDTARVAKSKKINMLHVDKLSRDLKLGNDQQETLSNRYNNLMLHLDYANDSIENEQDKRDFQSVSISRYNSFFEGLLTSAQKEELKAMLEKKIKEVKFN